MKDFLSKTDLELDPKFSAKRSKSKSKYFCREMKEILESLEDNDWTTRMVLDGENGLISCLERFIANPGRLRRGKAYRQKRQQLQTHFSPSPIISNVFEEDTGNYDVNLSENFVNLNITAKDNDNGDKEDLENSNTPI
eukprot:Pgem_evm1s16094